MTDEKHEPLSEADWPGRVELWDAINEYTTACRGMPKSYVYGNTARQNAVAKVESLVREAIAARDARIRELEEALTLAQRWIGDGDPVSTFEDIAAWFYRETGMLRPGKSMPAEMGDQDEKRRAAWEEWREAKGKRVRDVVSRALAARRRT